MLKFLLILSATDFKIVNQKRELLIKEELDYLEKFNLILLSFHLFQQGIVINNKLILLKWVKYNNNNKKKYKKITKNKKFFLTNWVIKIFWVTILSCSQMVWFCYSFYPFAYSMQNELIITLKARSESSKKRPDYLRC